MTCPPVGGEAVSSTNLVLIGYRGTGKSSVACLVGRLLERPVVSLDEEIVRRAGKPIPEIVQAMGWLGFRDLESAVCRECASLSGRILDCGGGVVEREENARILGASGRVFWLVAAVDTIVHRIAGGTDRPALTTGQSFLEEVAEVLARRTPLYSAMAQHHVVTDGRSVEAVAAEIAQLWHKLELPPQRRPP